MTTWQDPLTLRWENAVTEGDATQIGDLLRENESLLNLECFNYKFRDFVEVLADDEEVAELMNQNGGPLQGQYGDSALLYAVSRHNFKLVKLLLEMGAQVDQQNEEGASALMYASELGNYELTKLLLEKGAQVDLTIETGDSALMSASDLGHYEVVKLLLERGAQVDLINNEGVSALMCASANGHCEVAKLLLENGAQVDLQSKDGRSALMYASDKGHGEVVQLLLDNCAQVDLQSEDGKSAAMYASEAGHPEIVELLKTCTSEVANSEPPVSVTVTQDDQEETSINKNPDTPVILPSADPDSTTNNSGSPGADQAQSGDGFETRGRDFTFSDHLYEYGIYKGCSAVRVTSLSEQGGDARLLLEKGASAAAVQKESLQVDLQDEDGQSALMFASVSGYYEVARLLLENGARVDLQDEDGRSALMLASVRGDSEAAALLLQHGAQVDLQDKTGRSALMYASKHAQCDVAELLLDRGADIDLQSTQWESAMSLALSQEQSTLVQQQLQKQAKLISLLEKKISLLDEGKEPVVVQNVMPILCSTVSEQELVPNSPSVQEVLLSLKTLSLIKWRDQQGHQRKFRLVAKISSRWRELGRLVGLEEDELDGWESQYRGAPVMCWTRTMKYWLCSGEDTSEYPATWEGLCSLLEDIECAKIAKELKKVLSRAISPPPPPPPPSSSDASQKPMPDTAPGPDSLVGKFLFFLVENFHITI